MLYINIGISLIIFLNLLMQMMMIASLEQMRENAELTNHTLLEIYNELAEAMLDD